MNVTFRVAGALLLCAGSLNAETRSCTGSVSLQDFRLLAAPSMGGNPLTLARVNILRTGDRLIYQPVRSSANAENKARIAVILVPASEETSARLQVLPDHPADKAAEWDIPFRVGIVGVVFGPQGLDVKKVDALVTGKDRLVSQLADYAEQTARVGALVDTLSAWEQSPTRQTSLNAILSGFSSQYGIAIPKLNPTNPADQQAALLLRAVLPPLSSYDPLSPQPSARVQQSAGLAATVASLFFGSPVALAAGGAALFQNLRALMFPETDFRSAFAQSKGGDEVALCSEPRPGKSRTRSAYLWALRLPACGPPSLALSGDLHLPIGWKSSLKVTAPDTGELKLLSRVQGWQLVSAESGEAYPVQVTATGGPAGDPVLDLSQSQLAPGAYRLAGKWDWDTFAVPGTLHLHRFGTLAAAQIPPQSKDRLLAGAGPVRIEIAGTDFQFIDRVALLRTDRVGAPPLELPFTLPAGKSAGPQSTLQTEVDTRLLPAGVYRLRLTQINQQSCELPVTVHPPVPTIENLPLRVNSGEKEQIIRLRGNGLDRISQITGRSMDWELGPPDPPARERSATVRLREAALKGERLGIVLTVQGLHEAVPVPEAVEVAGPRPRVLSAEKSLASSLGVELREGELPAALPVSFAIRTENTAGSPTLELSCGPGSAGRPVALRPGEGRDSIRLDSAGQGILFLSLDAGGVGSTGCSLTAAVSIESTGRSDPFLLGHVVQLPEIDRFELTEQKTGESLFVGVITGKNLHRIEKTGWDDQHGFDVLGIPTPETGEPQKQTLKIALPWPSPTPRAPIFIWLRGEKEGRATRVTFSQPD